MMFITKALLLIALVPFLTSALEDGFICPKLLPSEFVKDLNPKYPHPTNCQKYYVCLKGVTPVEQNCYPGEVFNNNSKQCDLPENVIQCIDWYKDHPAGDIDADGGRYYGRK
ncbi:uncharacterized protein LOC124198204 [Daphnia pulex]|uniref:uncharacterized protein LOC124198204 n=1 Tax=Daphnia pulex TaxID=6669 RepID=UPI001EDDC9E6|nr:uncharacterized protein LOC124198204 [Daphnia pulex]